MSCRATPPPTTLAIPLRTSGSMAKTRMTSQVTGSLPQLPIDGSLVTAYLAYMSLAQDMEHAQAALEELARREKASERFMPISRALWVAALIDYNRCWTAGHRKQHADSVAVPPDLLPSHRLFRRLRGDHVAH